MFKISTLLRALLSVGFIRFSMTEDDTSSVDTGQQGLPGGGGPGLEGTPGNEPSGVGELTVDEYAALPRAWKKELEPHWKTAPREVREFAHRREADVEKGIRTYYDGHKKFSDLDGVFRPYMEQNPGIQVDTAALYRNLAENHLALVQAKPEDRRELFLQMAQFYGVDFANAAASGQGVDQKAIAKLVQDQVQQGLQPFVAERQRAHFEATTKQVDAFFRDPQNKYVEQVAPAMLEIIQSGTTTDLSMAYEMAILRNPEVKALYLAELAQSGAGGQGGARAPGDRNVQSSTGGAPPAKHGSIDDTMNAVVSKHFPGYKPPRQA